MDPRWWKAEGEFPKSHVLDTLSFYVSAVGESLPYPGKMDVCLIAAFSQQARTLYTGDWNDFQRGIIQLKEQMGVSETVTEVFESPIAQGISKALAYVNKHKKTNVSGRILVLECSKETTDFATQSVPLSNCGCSANGVNDSSPLASISVVSLASNTPSSALMGLCVKTGGVHIPLDKCRDCGSLLQALIFHLTPPIRTLKTRPQSQRTHMNTTCVCHNKSVDKGYVCSVCLAIYCIETAGICSVCGSRVRREAKDELPIHAQIFSKLYPVTNMGAVFQ